MKLGNGVVEKVGLARAERPLSNRYPVGNFTRENPECSRVNSVIADRAATFPLLHYSSSHITGCFSSIVPRNAAVSYCTFASFPGNTLLHHPVRPPRTCNYMPAPLSLCTAASNYTCYALPKPQSRRYAAYLSLAAPSSF